MRKLVALYLPVATYSRLADRAAAQHRHPREEAAVIVIDALGDGTPASETSPYLGSFDDRDRGFGPGHRLVVTLPDQVADALREAAERDMRSIRGQAAAVLEAALSGKGRKRT